jgi:branched-subunit amino acid transport protein
MNRQHPYAPGTIEHHTRRMGTPAQRRELALWLKRSLAFAAVCALLALVAGTLVGN